MSRWTALTRNKTAQITAAVITIALVSWGSYGSLVHECEQAGDSYCAYVAVGFVLDQMIFWGLIGIVIGGVAWTLRRKRKPARDTAEL
ncbi:MAG: hypothetical protein PVI01_12965 [Gemmatimonadales bacterium]